ncbi:hypothetical protein EWM64_g6644 [Hericium alpestre]|uniref:Transcription factor domain-containing protein n=1 Tax=Hericium alpestre TaxID=135208 RepID=A0A4Y9ZT26_9AGAM|nr:hypothetical protein EWM64_g6644 [Hericium alpestre]
MKCDGVRPVCGQCARSNKRDECGYHDSAARSRTQILEEEVAVLEARIRQLENPEDEPVPGPIMLRDPHARFHSSQSPTAPDSSQSSAGPSGPSSPVVGFSGGSLSRRSSISSPIREESDEPSTENAQLLLDVFFEHSSQLGWFMHTTRFRHALALPEGNPNRPLAALVDAVYLLGASNMRQITGAAPIDEHVYVSRALRNVGLGLADAPSHRVVQVIQARVLLAFYHYGIGKFMEGRHQSDAAASLVLFSGMHKIRSTQSWRNVSSFVDVMTLSLPAPQDQVEEGERINALWTVFTICRVWAVAFGAPVLLSDNDALGTQIDTPWPLDMETYERGPVYPNFRTSSTLRNFLAGINTSWPWENHSMLAQISNAAALFDRATYLASCWRPDIANTNAFYANFITLDQRIDEFKTQLYYLENLNNAGSDIIRTMHAIHCLTDAATIQLHSPFAQQNVLSRSKAFTAARAIVRANITVRAHEFLIINPMLGIVWAAACQVFIRELLCMRSIPAGATPLLPDREAEVRGAVDQLQAMMAVFAPVSAFINYQLVKVQQELMGL